MCSPIPSRQLPPLLVPDLVYAPQLSPSTESSCPSPESEGDTLDTPRHFFSSNLHPEAQPICVGHHTRSIVSDPQLKKDSATRTASHWRYHPFSSAPCSPKKGDFGSIYSAHPSKTSTQQRPARCYNPDPSSVPHVTSEPTLVSCCSSLLPPPRDTHHYHDIFTRTWSGRACVVDPHLIGRSYSDCFPPLHVLNPSFIHTYCLGDELGAGGFGFVMTAIHRNGGYEVAVKFIIKDKVPEQAWVEDTVVGRVPMEVMLLCCLDHDNIVKCYDLFEDDLYFYLVQELHGSPWPKVSRRSRLKALPSSLATSSSLPALTTGSSIGSASDCETDTPSPRPHPQHYKHGNHSHSHAEASRVTPDLIISPPAELQSCKSLPSRRPDYRRRPSHDLFECIEQSSQKRLSESQARYVFAQVVDAVFYLDQQGITHRDIKDENLVISKDLHVKLIDFGSAIITDPTQPRPYHTLFFGTTAYAAPEVLLKKPYQAPPAEIWTLGVLLSFLLTGTSAVPSEADAVQGRIVLNPKNEAALSAPCLSLLHRCLELDPVKRADIHEVRTHPWLVDDHHRGSSAE